MVFGMVGNGRGEKTSGRFMRVGSERVRVVFFTEDARERGGRSGDSDGSEGRMLRWSGLWERDRGISCSVIASSRGGTLWRAAAERCTDAAGGGDRYQGDFRAQLKRQGRWQ